MKCFRIFAAFALIVALMSGAWAACAMAEGDSARQYAEAAALLQAGNYAGAAQAYSMLGNYEDSSRMAMYCQAIAAGERGYYSLAVSNLKKLGDFRDAALQSNYYAALSYEAAEEYEKAQKLFAGMEYFMDVAERLATYPGKILARDYAAADAAEQAGDYAAAYEGFKALGDYEDSPARAAAVQDKGNYAKAVKCVGDGKYAEA